MKKTLFILAVLFSSVSSSFAWTGGHYFYTSPGSWDSDYASLNINAYCAELELNGYTYSSNPNASASIDLWANNGDYTYSYVRQNTSNQEYVYYRVATGPWQPPYAPTYFGTVNVYVETYDASASFSVLWTAV